MPLEVIAVVATVLGTVADILSLAFVIASYRGERRSRRPARPGQQKQ